MKRLILALIFAVLSLGLAACGGAAAEPPPTEPPVATSTPEPTAIPAPTATPQPSLSESAAACLTSRLGEQAAQGVMSGLITPTAEQQAARSDCLLAASLKSAGSDGAVATCLTAKLGEALARVVASRAIPLTESESAALGECLLSSAAASTSGSAASSLVTCLEQELAPDLARALASGVIPPSADQESLLGNCVLGGASGTTGGSLDSLFGTSSGNPGGVSDTMLACLQRELGDETASVVAAATVPLSADQEAAKGGCLLEAALGGG